MALYWIYMVVMFGAACFGWIALLIVGIYRKRKQLAGSNIFIILGSIWAIPGIGFAALIGLMLYHISIYEPAKIIVFDPATYEGETGTIAINYQNAVTLECYTTNNMINYQLTGSNGMITAPAGYLALHRFETEKEDLQGSWSLSARFWNREKIPIIIMPNQSVSLQAGPPLTAKIKVIPKANKNVSLNFQLRGSYDSDYSIVGPKHCQEIPHFEIRDKRGDIVLSGKFSYG